MNSPLNFATPVVGVGPSFARDEKFSVDVKPAISTNGNGGSNGASTAGGGAKRKSPDADEEGDNKRPKIES